MKEYLSELLTLTLNKQLLQKIITLELVFAQSKKENKPVNRIILNKANYEQNNCCQYNEKS